MNKLFQLIFIYFFCCKINLCYSHIDSVDFTARIAIIDTQQIIDRSLVFQDIKKNVELISKDIQNSIIATDNFFKNIEDELTKKRQKLNEEAFNSEVKIFHNSLRDAKIKIKHMKSALESANHEAMDEVNKRIKEITSELATKYNFNLTLPSTMPLLYRSEIEITDEVLSILNNTLKTIKLNVERSNAVVTK